MVLQKFAGVGIIAVSVTVLYLISVLNPPTFVQIGIAFVGSIVCLIGIVVVFSEYRIEMKEVLGKTAPEAAPEERGNRVVVNATE